MLDDLLRSKLGDLTQPFQLCDEQGRVIGEFVPAVSPSEYERREPRFNPEELRKMIHSRGKRYTTAEVLKHLETLSGSM